MYMSIFEGRAPGQEFKLVSDILKGERSQLRHHLATLAIVGGFALGGVASFYAIEKVINDAAEALSKKTVVHTSYSLSSIDTDDTIFVPSTNITRPGPIAPQPQGSIPPRPNNPSVNNPTGASSSSGTTRYYGTP
jgi:hypothetical protein